MKQNGTKEVQVTHLGARAFFPDFSPDGGMIRASLRGSHAATESINGRQH
jgi:hypothetical protein